MNIHLPAPRRRWPARLVNLAVVLVVLALAAATFVLSYTGVHVIALQAGVSTRLARVYPATFDAVLVIACVAAVTLRDARWWVRSYAWFVIILVVAVVGAADAVHAMNVALRHRTIEGVVAATPWVLVLLGFSLMLTVLRHSRAQHAALAARPAQVPALPAAAPGATPVPEATQITDATVVDAIPAIDAPADVDEAPATDGSAEPGLHDDATATAPGQDFDPGEPAVSWHHYWDVSQEPGPGGQPAPDPSGDPESPRPASAPGEPGDQSQPAAGVADPDAPPFATAPFATVPRLNRVRSTPTPPEGDEP